MEKVETEQKTTQGISYYVFTDDLKKLLFGNMMNSPYDEVASMMTHLNNINDGLIAEVDLINIFKYLSKKPYRLIAGFFDAVTPLLHKHEEISDNNPSTEQKSESQIQSENSPNKLTDNTKNTNLNDELNLDEYI